MHPYYQQKAPKLKKQMNDYFLPIRSEISDRFHKPYEEAFEEIWQYYYSELLERFPYIGGDKVSGTKNLTGAYLFVAFGATGKKYGLSLDEWGRLTTLCFEQSIERMPAIAKKIGGFVFRNRRIANKILQKKDRKNHENALQHPGSFETKTQDPTEEYPVNFHNLVCPLHLFAEKYGYMEYMPYLCNLDYVMFGKMGLSLYREKTCATGDGYCDFKFKKNGSIPSYWPPHILDENDPLK